VHIGGWFPWDERRAAKKIGISPRRGYGWLHIRIGWWSINLSWDHRKKMVNPSVYDNIP
jgi:hypothetical protein